MNEKLCGEPAPWLFTWLGRDPIPICAKHEAWLAQVAGAIDLKVPIQPAPPGATCTQRVSK